MMPTPPRRRPQAIPADDPDLVVAPEPALAPEATLEDATGAAAPVDATAGLAPSRHRWSIGWGAVFFAALSMLGGLALALSFARFVAIALERHDWIGWLAFGLLALAGLAFVVIVGREIVGLVLLRRLGRTRRQLETAIAKGDIRNERRALEHIFGHLSDRPELKWALAGLAEHARGINDPGDLARLADRDVMPVLDGQARRVAAASARRVSVVTAMSPTALLTVGWVLVENLRMLRALAGLYGGRPGFIGTMRIARLVFTHIVATGGIAMTDDLLGQFLGQDLVRRLSRRLGESVFNAALTARVAAAAIEVIRPIPYIAAPRVRARDLVAGIVKSARGSAGTRSSGPVSSP